MKKLFINGRFLTREITGVQRFALEIIYELDKLVAINTSLYLVILVPKKSNIKIGFKNIKIKKVGILNGHFWEQIELPLYCLMSPLVSFCNTAPILKRRQLVTIHDAAVFAGPEWFSLLFRTWYKILFRILSKTVNKIITVSKFSSKELQKYLKIKPEKLAVIYNGWEHIKKIDIKQDILKKYNLEAKKYILAVSSLNIRKNFNIIIDAIHFFKQQDVYLVIVGGADERIFGKINLKQNPKIIFTGYVTDSELKALYENAACFVFPSFYEGFGLPPLEAMACGCPVVLSNASSLPEIGGEAALYFDPNNSEMMMKQIISVLQNDEVKKNLQEKAKAQLKKFSWEKSAAKYMKIFQEI